jgi:hypothetical protein
VVAEPLVEPATSVISIVTGSAIWPGEFGHQGGAQLVQLVIGLGQRYDGCLAR